MATNKLTDLEIRHAIRHAQALKTRPKLFDGDGMYLHINTRPVGSNLWRRKYYVDGIEKLDSFGPYPDISLADAREKRDAARKLIAKGIDPVHAKREKREAATEATRHRFEVVAEDYFAHNVAGWSERHQRDVRRILDELIAGLGKQPISAIKVADVRRVIDAVVARNAIVYANDVRLYFRQVIKHFNSERERPIADPSALVKIPKAPKVSHHAMLEPQEIPGFLRALRNSDASPITRIAVRMLLLSALRTTELRMASWSEIDTKDKIWRVPQRRMKNRASHLVPLSTQMQELLTDLRLLTGAGALLFPNTRDASQPMSENAIIFVLYRLGLKGKLTSHGFRAMFSSWGNEKGYNADAIELQLSHVPGNKVRTAYNRAAYLDQRRELLQGWADYIDECERSATLRSVGNKAAA